MESLPIQTRVAPGLQAVDADRLAEAFRVFSHASQELADAYAGLQRQVAELTAELAAANGELRRQYREKAALTERLAMLLDALPAGVVVVNGEGRVEQCNPAAQTILGASPINEAWDAFAQQHLLDSGNAAERVTGCDAQARRVSVGVTDIDSAGARIVLLHDVTAAQRLKDHAARNERLAAMGEMVASLAHQLRTPLAAALLFAANLRTPELRPQAREHCAAMTVGRLKELDRLIQSMLLFARGDVLGREPVRAARLLEELAEMLEPIAQERGIALRITGQGSDAELVCNRKALTGALANLVDNALQASSGGEVELDLCVDEDTARFRVRDDGPGIDPAAHCRLFQPFYTTRPDGTGLGLAVARAVARAHGGDVEFRSLLGRGTEFTLSVTLARASGVPASDGESNPGWNVQ